MALTCNACLKMYPNTSSLHTHIKVVHKTTPSSLGHAEKDWHYVCLEKGCKKLFKSSQILSTHLKKHHGFKFEQIQITLKDLKEFLVWKAKIELNQDYKYVLKNTMSNKKHKLLYYRCNKCHKPEQTVRKSGSKIQTYCTSQIKLYKEHNKDAVMIYWIKTHYGHGIEISNFKNKFDDEDILETIKTVPKRNKRGRKRKKIEDDSDSSIDTSEASQKDGPQQDLDQLNFATREDKLDVKPKSRTVFNNSIDSDPILFHKRQESRRVEHFETNDFCLIIMNNYQKDMLKQFGNNIVTVDSTQSLNDHDFDLTMLAVLDENNQGFPVAYMLCNRKDILTFTFFFKTIKKAVGMIYPKIFMTDLIDSYNDAWIKVMGAPIHHLFCPWRIEQAWALDLNKISDAEKKQEVSEIIMTLQKEPEEYNFQIMLNDILDYLLEDEMTEQFGKYFKNNYCGNYQKWAFCLQQEYGISSNVNLESIHELTNYFDLVLLKERSFDKVLQAVFKYIGDKIAERSSKDSDEKKSFLNYQVEYIDNFWNVTDQDELVFKVTKFSDEQCCDNVCRCCNLCLHMFTCDCFNYQTNKMVCIHIHSVINKLGHSSQSSKRSNKRNESHKKNGNLDTMESPFVSKKIKKDNDLEDTKNEKINTSTKSKSKANASELKKLIESTFGKLQTVKLDNLANSVMQEISTHLNIIEDLIFKCPRKNRI